MHKRPGEQNGVNHCHRTEYGRGGVGDEDSLRGFWDNVKCMNICIIGRVPDGEEREMTRDNI